MLYGVIINGWYYGIEHDPEQVRFQRVYHKGYYRVADCHNKILLPGCFRSERSANYAVTATSSR